MPVSARQSWFKRPELGAASISQAMAPTKGGVTSDSITRVRTVRRIGMSVRATSQPSGAATAQQIALVEKAMMRVVISGSTKVGSVNRATKLPSVALTSLLAGYWPLRSTMNAWPSADMIQPNSSRAALGLGADLNTAMGLEICGVPSTGCTTSIGEPRSLAIQNK